MTFSPIFSIAMSPLKHSLLLLVLCLSALPAAAGMYKWTDAQGTVHYSQFPPAGVKAQEIRVQAPPPAAEPAPARADSAGPAKAPPRPPESPELARQRAENCKTARYNLVILQRNPHVRIKEADGGYRVLTPGERQRRIDDLQSQIDQFCSDVPE